MILKPWMMSLITRPRQIKNDKESHHVVYCNNSIVSAVAKSRDLLPKLFVKKNGTAKYLIQWLFL